MTLIGNFNLELVGIIYSSH